MLKKEGYKYIYSADGEHALLNIETGLLEFFSANKNFSGWGISWRNTKLEFNRSYNHAEMQRFKQGLNKIQNYGEQHPSFMRAHRLLKKLK